MNFQSVTQLPTVLMMYSSCAEMNVAVSQAIPNRAIADTMPALNTDMSGTVFTSGRPISMIATADTNITSTIVVVMSIGTSSPPSPGNDGRRSGNRPNTTISTTPVRNARAEFRPAVVYVSAEEAGTGPDAPAPPLPPAGEPATTTAGVSATASRWSSSPEA